MAQHLLYFFNIPLATLSAWATVLPNSLAFYLKELKSLSLAISASKSSASSTVVPSIFVIHLVNGAQFLNVTCAAGAATTVISPVTKM